MKTVNTSKILILLLIVGLAFSGCSMFRSGDKKGAGDGLSEADLNAQREGRFGAGGIPTAEGEGMFRDIGFDYDSSAISDIARQEIEYNVEILRQNSDIRVQLEGHCDERGTAEYNLALGADRARAVKEVLASYGIPASRLDSISYGEEVPLDPGHSESSWSRNRRVHFSGFKGNTGGSAKADSAGTY